MSIDLIKRAEEGKIELQLILLEGEFLLKKLEKMTASATANKLEAIKGEIQKVKTLMQRKGEILKMANEYLSEHTAKDVDLSKYEALSKDADADASTDDELSAFASEDEAEDLSKDADADASTDDELSAFASEDEADEWVSVGNDEVVSMDNILSAAVAVEKITAQDQNVLNAYIAEEFGDKIVDSLLDDDWDIIPADASASAANDDDFVVVQNLSAAQIKQTKQEDIEKAAKISQLQNVISNDLGKVAESNKALLELSDKIGELCSKYTTTMLRNYEKAKTAFNYKDLAKKAKDNHEIKLAELEAKRDAIENKVQSLKAEIALNKAELNILESGEIKMQEPGLFSKAFSSVWGFGGKVVGTVVDTAKLVAHVADDAVQGVHKVADYAIDGYRSVKGAATSAIESVKSGVYSIIGSNTDARWDGSDLAKNSTTVGTDDDWTEISCDYEVDEFAITISGHNHYDIDSDINVF